MYPHWRALLPELSISSKAGLSLFSYGFYRGYSATYSPPNDLVGYRLALGFFNGVFHMFPPYGLLRLTHIANRAEVAYTGKDPKNYPSIYTEFLGLGYNERVL